jgi:hypothetical protein
VYALGCLLHAMLVGEPPARDGADDRRVNQRVGRRVEVTHRFRAHGGQYTVLATANNRAAATHLALTASRTTARQAHEATPEATCP